MKLNAFVWPFGPQPRNEYCLLLSWFSCGRFSRSLLLFFVFGCFLVFPSCEQGCRYGMVLVMVLVMVVCLDGVEEQIVLKKTQKKPGWTNGTALLLTITEDLWFSLLWLIFESGFKMDARWIGWEIRRWDLLQCRAMPWSMFYLIMSSSSCSFVGVIETLR